MVFLRAMLGSKERPSELPPHIIATFHVELGEHAKLASQAALTFNESKDLCPNYSASVCG
jgi:hypothetical protein